MLNQNQQFLFFKFFYCVSQKKKKKKEKKNIFFFLLIKKKKMRNFYISFFFFLLFFIFVFSVDRSKFKKCDQSGFCKRNREANNEGRIELIENSLRMDGNALVGRLVSSRSDYQGKTLIFRFNVLKSGILRLQMDEENIVKERYRVPGVLLEQENIDFEFDSSNRRLKWGRNVSDFHFFIIQ